MIRNNVCLHTLELLFEPQQVGGIARLLVLLPRLNWSSCSVDYKNLLTPTQQNGTITHRKYHIFCYGILFLISGT
jgi:hypothetical protein